VTSGDEGTHCQKAVVFLHDRALANGSDSNVKMARRYAAAMALEKLKVEPSILNGVCNCRISLMKRDISTEEMDDDDNNGQINPANLYELSLKSNALLYNG
jgi:hypothetical protein